MRRRGCRPRSVDRGWLACREPRRPQVAPCGSDCRSMKRLLSPADCDHPPSERLGLPVPTGMESGGTQADGRVPPDQEINERRSTGETPM
jgi:hypothetical protein